MELQLHSGRGKVSLSDNAFARDFNQALVHQVVTAYLAKGRSGTKAQKTRAEARGGGRKPWAQKGSGRARAGTRRSPIWVGGGRTFAAKPRDFAQKVNKKMYRGAMQAILSELVRQQRLLAVKEFALDAPKTKDLVAKLAELKLGNVLIVVESFDENLALASRNLPDVHVLAATRLDPVSLVSFDQVLFTVSAIRKLEEALG